MALYCAENGLSRVGALLDEVLPRNPLQQGRLGTRRACGTPDEYRRLPFLTKQDLVADSLAHPPFGSNLTYPLEQYTRYHQTSGTTAAPLRVLDTPRTWDWWGHCWLEVLRQAGVTAGDRLFFAFSFAPSIGFWSAHHGATLLGALCIPSGGASSVQRLRMILDTGATVLLGTPSYILHLAETARREGISLSDAQVRTTIHAGEPGASIPATRARIAEAWNAQVIDHAGATETGAYGLGCPLGLGIHLNEDEFVAEVLDLATDQPVAADVAGELVLTSLGRGAWPTIRYRSGDIVRPRRGTCRCGSARVLFEGGILGRVDDMVTIRGLNLFPSAVEGVIRSLTAAEFRIVATRPVELDELSVELEGNRALADQAAKCLHEHLGFRVPVEPIDRRDPGAIGRQGAAVRRPAKTELSHGEEGSIVEASGQVVVITGAGRGIGLGLARYLAGQGASVVINDSGVELDGTPGEPDLAAHGGGDPPDGGAVRSARASRSPSPARASSSSRRPWRNSAVSMPGSTPRRSRATGCSST